MIYSVKSLSLDQRLAIGGLFGRSVSEQERIGVRTIAAPPVPDGSGIFNRTPGKGDLYRLSEDEIEAGTAASRRVSAANTARRTLNAPASKARESRKWGSLQ